MLGPVRARLGGVELDLGAPQQRTVLAMLLLREGAVATLGELIEGLWGPEPPRSAIASIRTYMSRLRSVLDDAGAGMDTRVDSVRGGYVLHTLHHAVDVSRFQRHTARGAEAARRGDWLTTVAEHGAALKLWHGQPLVGALGPYVEGQRLRLQQLAAAARVDLFRAMVGLGRYGEALPELAAMAAAHPLREDLQGLLMTALYGSGRVAEALQQYQQTRRALIDDLGIEPGVQLREVHQRILAGDLTLAAAVSGPPAPAGRTDRRLLAPHRVRTNVRLSRRRSLA
ncbi:hypothetical protein GCM10023322_76070 [Rugosimonospora acidiphila]|uniref:OmpR/PhoB-type domain-containing protein n=1 Tax=Rugosimonospora acidiphila TaxID=556531 RepID=A0ABP9SPI2_9ACTN